MQDTPKQILSRLIRERRSVRAFHEKPVDVKELEAIFEDIAFMPCPTNRLCFRFIVIRNKLQVEAMRQEIITEIDSAAKNLDPEEGEKFRKYADFFTFFHKAPVSVVGLYRHFVSRLPSGESQGESIQGLAETQAFGGAVAALLLSLHAHGLSSCWMTGPLIAEKRILQLLEIEAPWRLGAVLPIGYPREKPQCPNKPSLDKILAILPDA